MATRPQKHQEQMCIVTVGHRDFLTNSKNGMRIVELMQNVIEVDQHYRNGYTYEPRLEQPGIELKLIKPSQVIARKEISALMLDFE